MHRTPLLLAIWLSATAPLAAQQPTPPRVWVLEGVTVVDVVERRLLPDHRVVIRGERIESVGPARGALPTDAELRVAGAGLFVTPGLIDDHIHLSPGMVPGLTRALHGGVTMVQVMAGDNRQAGDVARRILTGELVAPELAYASVMAGPAFHSDPRFRAGSLGYEVGTAPWLQAVTSETDVPRAVAAARGSGAEVLKLYAMMDGDLVAALTSEAHRQGMRVVSHSTVYPARPSELVAAGVDILTHVGYLGWEAADEIAADEVYERRTGGAFASVAPDGPELTALFQEMARRGTYLEPTLHVFDINADSAFAAWTRAVTKRAHDLGVPIVAGTDALIGPQPGSLPNVHHEMELMVEAGLTPAQALATSTVTAARAMGRGDSHGVVAPGRVADLLLLTENPLADIRATRSIRMVVKRGRLIDR